MPVHSDIDIEDSESILLAIRATPDDQPIDLILHTPGGLVLAAEQIAHALVLHRVVSFVAEVLLKHLPRDRAVALATALAEGRWTHDFPITVEAARELGLSMSTDMPPVLDDLVASYPQPDAACPTGTSATVSASTPDSSHHGTGARVGLSRAQNVIFTPNSISRIDSAPVTRPKFAAPKVVFGACQLTSLKRLNTCA